MSALLESLLAGVPPGDEGALAPLRAQALREARAAGLPHARNEAWKYTSLRALERRAFARAESVSGPSTTTSIDAAELPDGARLVFVNGRFEEGLSRLDVAEGVTLQPLSRALAVADPAAFDALSRRYEGATHVFATLNAGLAAEGAHVRIAPGIDAGTLHLVFIGAAAPDAAWHLRHLVELGEDARLVLCEHRLAQAPHAHLANEIAHLALAPRATLQHVRVQHEADGATVLLRTDAKLAQEATYHRLDLELGAALARHELNVTLAGERAKLHANGVLLAGGRRHLDTRLGIDHAARDTSSQLTWRAIGAGRGRAVFHGGILIRAGADGSEAQLANKNLLLSEGAEIDTQPVLEIHADEVKAAHGAAVGQLNEAALFYLRSRGIPQAQARAMLTAAFLREVLDVVGPPELVEALAQRVDQALSAAGPA